MLSRRYFLKAATAVGAGLAIPWSLVRRPWPAQAPSASTAVPLPPAAIPKFDAPLVIPPAMPRTSVLGGPTPIDYYEIAVRQFSQQILPAGHPATTVWGYGSVNHPGTFNYPSFTIEAGWRAPVRVKWINDLVDADGHFLPHLLPVDQTLHWANPPGGEAGRDGHGESQEPYAGPVPIVTHVHGAHAPDWADGYAEAWYLPAATDIPAGYAHEGSWYDTFHAKSGLAWDPGSATFDYPNDQRAATLWYHDHSLGMTRANVYAGPAGFFLLRGGPDDAVVDRRTGAPAVLPGPAPQLGDEPGLTYFEIPIAIQDRSFNDDGSLAYPDNRAFFEGLRPDEETGDETLPILRIPFHPEEACDGQMSDVAPIWNPEFFGNTIVVNGRTWPYLDVQRRRYRLRLLNGCDSRFLILAFDAPGVRIWQIGTEGGFLPAPIDISRSAGGRLLLGPAERADVIVDFRGVRAGTTVRLLNLAPDEPFGGGEPGVDFQPADPATTGQVMAFRVLKTSGSDPSTPPRFLRLPAIAAMGSSDVVRPLSLNEEMSKTVRIVIDDQGDVVLACGDSEAEAFGPVAALLGTFDPGTGMAEPMTWMAPTTDNPRLGDTETWEFYNFTADAHPIHIHEVQFRVVDRQALATDEEGMAVQPASLVGSPRPPESWESGYKDTVIAYPGEVTRVQATFDIPGRYVWHCHILEHEDNEMMRPYDVVE
ncbi:MAG TPA: multicopper oxidase [Candidatus Limnocylindrales bacterium]|nr:multicopper oxidase [Candidatus Limnocylindrales bacterium]